MDSDGSAPLGSDEEYEYESDDGMNDYAADSPTKASTMADSTVEVLKPSFIRREMNKVVGDVAEMLDVPAECAATLLRHFRWDKEKLFDRYYANDTDVRKEAGIAGLGVSAKPTEEFECGVCLDDTAPSDGFSLGCKHTFCRNCWSDHLRIAVAGGMSCVDTRCMLFDCNEAVTEATVSAMADSDTVSKYEQHVLRQFVAIDKSMAWCPAPDCPNAFIARGFVTDVSCDCGMRFCFRCGQEAHRPVDCNLLETWLEKCNNESETANWILANTKRCPKCRVRIEKNQGCNHMTCSGCKHEFCWICTGEWSEHSPKTGGYYTCNRYVEKKAKGRKGAATAAETQADIAKRELDRYLHYYRRYAGHDQAGKFATRVRKATAERIRKIQSETSGEWVDMGFLSSAAEMVIECRRVLKYTYVLCYYLRDGPEKSLLEHQQEMLERHTEALAELTERQTVSGSDRAEVTNYTRVTRSFVDHIMGDVEAGAGESYVVGEGPVGVEGPAGAGAGDSSGRGSGAGSGSGSATRGDKSRAAARGARQVASKRRR